MRVLFTCGREPEYPRNAVVETCLRRNFEVLSATSSLPRIPLRYAHLTKQLLQAPTNYDLMYVGFLGHPLMIPARLLTRKPIVFDAFISAYDTLCLDRQLFGPGSLIGRFAFWLDRLSCALADLVVLDTQANARFFHRTLDVPLDKLRVLFVGCDETIFYPRPPNNVPEEGASLVLFFGSFLPLHGIDIIIRAAKLLETEPDIRFRLIGRGMEYDRIRSLAREWGLENVEFRSPVPLSKLPDEIARATVCLGGHFSEIGKAKRVIAGKTFQCLAMGKSTIVGDNSANRELLTPDYDARFCPMGDPKALASAISTLVRNPGIRTRLGHNARLTFMERASIRVLSRQMRQIVDEAATRDYLHNSA